MVSPLADLTLRVWTLDRGILRLPKVSQRVLLRQLPLQRQRCRGSGCAVASRVEQARGGGERQGCWTWTR